MWSDSQTNESNELLLFSEAKTKSWVTVLNRSNALLL